MLFANPPPACSAATRPSTPALGLNPTVRASLLAGLDRPDERLIVLLAEVHATGGDPLKLTQLFGISDPTAIHYCAELGPFQQSDDQQPMPPTRCGVAMGGRHWAALLVG